VGKNGTGATTTILGMEAAEYDALAMEHEVAMLQERIAELEFAREDVGWDRLDDSGTDVDLSREALRRIIRDAQIMSLKNPLIDHAVSVTACYVFGQGVQIAGRGSANDRVQAFLSDRGNLRTLTSQQALIAGDRQLTTEGNVFLACFSKPGDVTRVRRVPTFQVIAGDIIRNPDDDSDVWYYQRRWTRHATDKDGRPTTEERCDYYPDLWYDPTTKPARYGWDAEEGEVHWDSPVLHIKDGGLTGSRFGVPTVFSSLDWARAVSRDLSDYATVRRALARFAWRVIAKTKAGAKSVAEKMATSVTATNPLERNPPPITGSAFIGVEGTDIQPLRTSGAAPSPEEGRRLWLMVAAGTGIPETILSGNADAGNLATAKTLDRPTELMMKARQSVWSDALHDLVSYDLRRAREDGLLPMFEDDPTAPPAPEAKPDPITGYVEPTLLPQREVETDPDVTFPDILEDDVVARVGAIVQAATLGAQGTTSGTMPDELLSRLLLTALGVDDVDEVIAEMFPPAAPDEEKEDPLDAPTDPYDLPDDGTMYDPSGLMGTPDAGGAYVLPESRFREALDAFAESLGSGGGRPAAPRRRAGRPAAPAKTPAG